MFQVTAKQQYDGGYPANGIDAREGNIIIRKSTIRTYGYELYNTRLNKSFHWYRYKRDAIENLEEIRRYN